MTGVVDATAAQAVQLLDALEAATERLLASVEGLDGRELDAASLLPGWSRRTVVAHLTHVGRATIRMLGEVPSGRVAFYPGGDQERDRSLSAADQLPAHEVARRLGETCRDLRSAAGGVSAPTWERQVEEPRLGTIAASRLVLLRLTEVEVHHTDLDVGYLPRSWSPRLIDIGLPLRIAWLGAHHRHRHGADLATNGAWHLVRTDERRAWTVIADGPHVTVADGIDSGSCDAAFHGEGWRLLALLLGRDDLDQPADAQRFKRAFPGP